MATEVPERVFDTAGQLVRRLQRIQSPAEQQIALCVALAYHCVKHDIDPRAMVGVLIQNVRSLLADPVLRERAFERVRNIAKDSAVVVPQIPGIRDDSHVYNVGDLQNGKVVQLQDYRS